MTAPVCGAGHEITGDNAYTEPSGRNHCRECRARRDRDAYQLRKANRAKTAPIGSQIKRKESGGVQLPILDKVRKPYPWEKEAVTKLITRRYPDDATALLDVLFADPHPDGTFKRVRTAK